MQFLQKGGDNLDTKLELMINDRQCQIREIIFEDFQIFHDGIFTEKLCQTDKEFYEERNQNKANQRIFGTNAGWTGFLPSPSDPG